MICKPIKALIDIREAERKACEPTNCWYLGTDIVRELAINQEIMIGVKYRRISHVDLATGTITFEDLN